MCRVWRVLCLSLICLFLPLAALAGTTVITQCGQVVKGRAELAANLDCTTYDGRAITVERGRLKLNGFTVTGNPNLVALGCQNAVIDCLRRCKVIGPGTVTNGGLANCNVGAVDAGGGIVSDLTVTGNLGDGISSARKIVNSLITNNGRDGVANTGNVIKIQKSVISGNARDGVRGVSSTGAKLIETTVTNNNGYGVFIGGLKKIRLRRGSVVTGNGAGGGPCDDGSGGSAPCVDLFSRRMPTVDASSICETSLDRDLLVPWGVCSLD